MKNQNTKSQIFIKSVQNFEKGEGVSMSKAQNKFYWKNIKKFQKQKVFKKKSSEQVKTLSQNKTFVQNMSTQMKNDF